MSEAVNIRLIKKGSAYAIELIIDPDDAHFTNVVKRVAKSGIAVESHLILTSDADQWQRRYEKDGFSINNGNDDNSGKNTGIDGGDTNY